VFPPKVGTRPEHVLQVLQQWGRQGSIDNLHEVTAAAAACNRLVLFRVLLGRA
jgi:hypothetical protein